MRYRYRASQTASMLGAASPENTFFRKQAATWLLRLLQFELPVDDYFFSLVFWIADGPESVARRLASEVPRPSGRTREARDAAKALKELPATRSNNLGDQLENIFENHPVLRKGIMDCITRIFSESAHKGSAANPLQKIRRLFSLDNAAMRICLYAFGVGNFRPLEWFMEDQLELGRYANHRLLAAMLDINLVQLRERLGALRGLGIMEESENLRLNDKLGSVILNNSNRRPQGFFCAPLPKSTVAFDAFRIPDDDKNHVLKLLQKEDDEPVNILLYGAPGAGKTSFACCLAKMLNARAWSVSCLPDDSESDRRVSLGATLALAGRTPGSLVLVDEAEQILDTNWRDSSQSSAKAWLNDLLERKGQRIIWITNNIDHLDHAVRRRFTYSIHFEAPGIADAAELWQSVAKKERASRKLTRETCFYLARNYPVSVAAMQSAIRQARAIADANDFAACVERVLKAQVILHNDGRKAAAKPRQSADYDPAAICTITPPEKIEAKVKRLAGKLGAQTAGMGGMLFYGPPGTGKTAFAVHLAALAGLECLKFKASDFLGMYVGESEKNIRAAFERAASQKALLLIDEADSFIGSRESAYHGWEVSMVNEFLTNLESFEGICICTTNFRSILDIASMRRFSLKLEFRYAREPQLRALYQTLLKPLAEGEPTEDFMKRLCAQKCLAPGDFWAVRSQFALEDPREISHEALLEALLREQKLKLEQSSKRVGF